LGSFTNDDVTTTPLRPILFHDRASCAILEWQKLRCYIWRMTNDTSALTHLSDPDLLSAVRSLAAGERQATARLIAALAELDGRRIYLGEGCSSLFTYCTQVLHLSEHAASDGSRRRGQPGAFRSS
jgi:hypothetical protein